MNAGFRNLGYAVLMRKVLGIVVVCALVSACASTESQRMPAVIDPSASDPSIQAKRTFLAVVQTVEPVAEQECRARTTGVNCDFNIVVDERPDQPSNAYQTIDRQGRPIIAFNVQLIEDARNADELAFVLGHEAAHHIRGHIQRQRDSEMASAMLAGSLAALAGASTEVIRSAQETGALVGARAFSKTFELEADELGTVITARAGYDPVRGAEFFNRIPDPGDTFLGTHPPNAQRQELVRQTAAQLGL